MKNRKRLVVYSLLALPFVVFGVFVLTLDPVGRASFFRELKANTAQQFGAKVDTASPNPGDEAGAEGSLDEEGQSREGGGFGGGGGGGFDLGAMFTRRDADGDGKLTGDEVPDRMRENLDQTDTDQDGSLTLVEMQAGMSQMRGNRGEGRRGRRFDPAQMFADRDTDGDGKLTGEEISERIRQNLDEFDTDKDGSLTLEEFQAGMQQMRANFGGGGRGGRGGDSSEEDRPGRPQRPDPDGTD